MAGLDTSRERTARRSPAIIVHLLALEVTDDDRRQTAQRLLLGRRWQHRPQTRQLDPSGQHSARGGTLAGTWIDTNLLPDRRLPDVAVATRRASATRRQRRSPGRAQFGKL